MLYAARIPANIPRHRARRGGWLNRWRPATCGAGAGDFAMFIRSTAIGSEQVVVARGSQGGPSEHGPGMARRSTS